MHVRMSELCNCARAHKNVSLLTQKSFQSWHVRLVTPHHPTRLFRSSTRAPRTTQEHDQVRSRRNCCERVDTTHATWWRAQHSVSYRDCLRDTPISWLLLQRLLELLKADFGFGSEVFEPQRGFVSLLCGRRAGGLPGLSP